MIFHYFLLVLLRFRNRLCICTFVRDRNVVKRMTLERTGWLDNSIGKLDRNLLGCGKLWRVGNSFRRASLHFLCCETRATLNVELCDNPINILKD